MSESTSNAKLQSLQDKGCVKVVATERDGRRIQLRLPAEIPGVIPEEEIGEPPELDTLDFFSADENRARILEREDRRCFYCLQDINGSTYAIEHVVSRPKGDNSYRNVVAACRQCNNRKKASSAEDWLRTLYRKGFLNPSELKGRLSHLERLKDGELKPPERGRADSMNAAHGSGVRIKRRVGGDWAGGQSPGRWLALGTWISAFKPAGLT